MNSFIPTRAEALERLDHFLPRAAEYARTRNYDKGPGAHDGVSQLSPYIRTRLITEEEVTKAVLAKYSAKETDKFLQEIAWRTYWKGWLEMRPEVWSSYLEALTNLQDKKQEEGYQAAISGESGIACFDSWAKELVKTGYLHNHARMWFASIWIFTLKLPWELGAEFFFNHLLDADPASNTLSWRWVAGLHTKGKNYVARASNIEKYTEGRFHPAGELNESPEPWEEEQDFEKQPLHLPQEHPKPEGRIGHLMFPEDLSPPPEEVGEIAASAIFLPGSLKTSALPTKFLEGAVIDAANRCNGTILDEPFASSLNDWISAKKIQSIVISFPTVGPCRDFLNSVSLPIEPSYFVRQWDRQLWPHATGGFFKLKKALPDFFENLQAQDQPELFSHS